MRATIVSSLVLGCWTMAAATGTDHLECFKVNDPVKLQGLVDLDSPALGLDAGCKISKAQLLCVPVTKTVRQSTVPPLPVDGDPLVDDRVCYKIKCPDPAPADQDVSDQFGQRTLGKLKPKLVCTPARRVSTTTTTVPGSCTPANTPCGGCGFGACVLHTEDVTSGCQGPPCTCCTCANVFVCTPQACATDADCASGRVCVQGTPVAGTSCCTRCPVSSTTTSSSTSTTLPPSCSVGGDPCGQCGSGFCVAHCDPDLPSLVCIDSNGLGQQCTSDASCPAGTACIAPVQLGCNNPIAPSVCATTCP